MKETLLKIEGMTCDHCVHSVQKALEALTGVSQVKVQLRPGQALVMSEADLDVPKALRAIEEEGYQAHVL